jgi:hypothetical protein
MREKRIIFVPTVTLGHYKDPTVELIKSIDLQAKQLIVGGYAESVIIDQNVCLWCNEEAILLNLPGNRLITTAIGQELNIHGDFFLSGLDKNGQATGMTGRQIQRWLPRIRKAPILSVLGRRGRSFDYRPIA